MRFRGLYLSYHGRPIAPLKRGFPGTYANYGWDTEFSPETGDIRFLIVADPEGTIHVERYNNRRDPWVWFLSYASTLPSQAILWAHNLEVDLIAIASRLPVHEREAWYRGRELRLGYRIRGLRADVSIIWGGPGPCFGQIQFRRPSGKADRTVFLRDTAAFFLKTLDKVGRQLFGENKNDIPSSAHWIDWNQVPDGGAGDLDQAERRRDLVEWRSIRAREKGTTLAAALRRAGPVDPSQVHQVTGRFGLGEQRLARNLFSGSRPVLSRTRGRSLEAVLQALGDDRTVFHADTVEDLAEAILSQERLFERRHDDGYLVGEDIEGGGPDAGGDDILGDGQHPDRGDGSGRSCSLDTYVAYARQDARLTAKIGAWIVDECGRQDVTLPVSLPSLSAKVFRRRYLPRPIPALSDEVFALALRAYYGGRVQTWYKGTIRRTTWKYDLNSAYAAALADVPDLAAGRWESSRTLDPLGVYEADLTIHISSLPVTLGATGQRLTYPLGRVRGAWMGVELLAAAEQGFIEIHKLLGYRFRPGVSGSPWADFVEEQWSIKRRHKKGHIHYDLPKLLVNSLYGKTLAKIRLDGRWGPYLRADTMFHPFIGAYVTASCRARILRAHEVLGDRLVNVQTDGLWTWGCLPTSEELGAFSLEARADSLLVIRGNVYMPFVEGQVDEDHTKLHAFGRHSHFTRSELFIEALQNRGKYPAERWRRRDAARKAGAAANLTTWAKFTFNWNRPDFKMKFPPFHDFVELSTCVFRGEPYLFDRGDLK
jgi:hypothetical protein